jgi:hypothetical protein
MIDTFPWREYSHFASLLPCSRKKNQLPSSRSGSPVPDSTRGLPNSAAPGCTLSTRHSNVCASNWYVYNCACDSRMDQLNMTFVGGQDRASLLYHGAHRKPRAHPRKGGCSEMDGSQHVRCRHRHGTDHSRHSRISLFSLLTIGCQTVAMIYSAVLFMTLYPEVQAKAQAELDAVVGTHRLPTISDRQDLPYLNAVIKEIFRCAQIVDQSLPHLVRTDDVHEGYFIPKGSLVIANLWYETIPPPCRSFFLTCVTGSWPTTSANTRIPRSSTRSASWAISPSLIPASSSSDSVAEFAQVRSTSVHVDLALRRHAYSALVLCQSSGRFFGENNIYLALAMFIATFNISKALDPQGKEITPVIEEKTDFAA